jgi:hypothetical protein
LGEPPLPGTLDVGGRVGALVTPRTAPVAVGVGVGVAVGVGVGVAVGVGVGVAVGVGVGVGVEQLFASEHGGDDGVKQVTSTEAWALSDFGVPSR